MDVSMRWNDVSQVKESLENRWIWSEGHLKCRPKGRAVAGKLRMKDRGREHLQKLFLGGGE